MPDWTEITCHGTRYRYRWDGLEHANPSARLDLESYRAGEWRKVKNYNTRDAFTMGYMAAETAAERVARDPAQASLFETEAV